jgi:hypothetical protein
MKTFQCHTDSSFLIRQIRVCKQKFHTIFYQRIDNLGRKGLTDYLLK